MEHVTIFVYISMQLPTALHYLHLKYDFCNMIFKIKHELCIA